MTMRRTIELADGAVSCLEWRSPGAPRLVFSHATGFNAETYRALLAPLAGAFNVVSGDFRGHGFSTLPTDPGSARGWTIFRDDLIALLGRLGREPAILAGHSMGAIVSWMVAALAPARVRALVLVEPVLLDPAIPAAPNRLALRAAQRRSVFPSLDAALDTYRGRSVFASWPEDVIRDYLSGGMIANADGSLRLACPPEWEAEIYREAPVDLAALAESVACPTTILYGSIDSTASPQQLAAILERRPGTRMACVEGASHFLPIEHPARVREEILRLLAR
jgi:pimeloyl-ACP methyl ester carboxylesterase